MTAVVRTLVIAALVLVALVLQVSFFPSFAYNGVVPNLLLLVVVAAALTRGAEFAMVLGFSAGLLVDLAPPADHVAGRWALALVLAGYLAGRVRQDAGQSALATIVTVAATSFVATSVFALSGLLLRDESVSVVQALQVIPVSVVYDVLLTPFVLPLMMRLFRRFEPHEVGYARAPLAGEARVCCAWGSSRCWCCRSSRPCSPGSGTSRCWPVTTTRRGPSRSPCARSCSSPHAA